MTELSIRTNLSSSLDYFAPAASVYSTSKCGGLAVLILLYAYTVERILGSWHRFPKSALPAWDSTHFRERNGSKPKNLGSV